jgi:hypothetical protein
VERAKVSFTELNGDYTFFSNQLESLKERNRAFEQSGSFYLKKFAPEFPHMPYLETSERHTERKLAVRAAVSEVLSQNRMMYNGQDTYFSDRQKEMLSNWGKIAYDLIYMSSNSRFQLQLKLVTEVRKIETKMKEIQKEMKKQRKLIDNEKRLSDLKHSKHNQVSKMSSMLITPNTKQEPMLSEDLGSTLSPVFRDDEPKPMSEE